MINLFVRRALSGLLCSLLIGLSSSLYAQEETRAETEGGASALTQGQAAVILARRLGLFAASTEAPPTQASAIQLLSARNIAPASGWDADAELDSGDLARMLVFALGLEGELSEAQLASADNDAFVDLLIEQYGVDVSQIASANDLDRSVPIIPGSLGDSSSDPLEAPPADSADEPTTVVDSAGLEAVLAAIVGGGAGGGGALAGEDEEAICAVISGIVGTPGNCIPAAP